MRVFKIKVLIIISLIYTNIYSDTGNLKVIINNPFFSPNFDRVDDFLIVEQSGGEKGLWIGEIMNSSGTIIKEFSWEGFPHGFKWNGKDKFNRIVVDGNYIYYLYFIDSSGDRLKHYSKSFTIDGAAPKIELNIEQRFISPNGDGIKDFPIVDVKIPAMEKTIENEISIISSETGKVNKYSRSILESLKDGDYTLKARVKYKNGFTSHDSCILNINREPPRIEIVLNNRIDFLKRSGEGYLNGTFIFSCIPEQKVDSFNFSITRGSKSYLEYTGLDSLNRPLEVDLNIPPGEYRMELVSRDLNGNYYTIKKTISIGEKLIEFGPYFKTNLPSIEFESYCSDTSFDFSEYIGLLKKYKSRDIIILSNSYDDGGDRMDLIKLSEERGEFVKDKLILHGIDEKRIKKINNGIRESNRFTHIYLK